MAQNVLCPGIRSASFKEVRMQDLSYPHDVIVTIFKGFLTDLLITRCFLQIQRAPFRDMNVKLQHLL